MSQGRYQRFTKRSRLMTYLGPSPEKGQGKVQK